MPPPPDRPLVIWRLTDARPGHEKQSLGLAQALARLAAAETHAIRVQGPWHGLRDWALGRFPAGDGLPDPDIILGAGHATHLALLAARRARGGRAVVLMRPSLPLALFDLCLIPEHDAPPARDNVFTTRGALNAAVPSERHDAALGVMLIGGVSGHYAWDSVEVARQAQAIARAEPGVHWQLTTSRRTPEDFLAEVSRGRPDNLAVLPHTATPPGWIEAALAGAAQAWVTEDSVSMLYEALTAGCAVGLIRLPGGRPGRLARGIEALVREGWVTPHAEWQRGRRPGRPEGRFDEAGRCARRIVERWFSGRAKADDRPG